MAVLQTILSPILNHSFYTLLALPMLFLILRSIQRIYFSPLSHVPGPSLWAASSSFLNYSTWIGTECTTVHQLHLRYGAVVRTGPDSVDIADGDALAPIYVDKG